MPILIEKTNKQKISTAQKKVAKVVHEFKEG